MLFPKVLIISTSLDFSTDLICLQLNNLKISYLRLNRDQLGEYDITLNPCVPELIVLSKEYSYLINSSSLVSVYYRAPSFLREIFQDAISDEEQLYKTQWAAFVRSLLLFENAKWMNNPADIYKAEMKPLQLLRAKQVGFNMPFTLVTNHILSEHIKSENIAIKSLDTAIINKGDDEAFIYTTLMNAKDVKTMHYSSPFFIQEGLIPKIDIRVTVIREDVIAVKIEGERGVDIDWRKYKGELKYELFSLPQEIKIKCVEVTRSLNLVFAAIDLVLHNDTFYFIEVNPTGEWAWLQKNTGYQFDVSIVENLI